MASFQMGNGGRATLGRRVDPPLGEERVKTVDEALALQRIDP